MGNNKGKGRRRRRKKKWRKVEGMWVNGQVPLTPPHVSGRLRERGCLYLTVDVVSCRYLPPANPVRSRDHILVFSMILYIRRLPVALGAFVLL
jgi:hypothetical protein